LVPISIFKQVNDQHEIVVYSLSSVDNLGGWFKIIVKESELKIKIIAKIYPR